MENITIDNLTGKVSYNDRLEDYYSGIHNQSQSHKKKPKGKKKDVDPSISYGVSPEFGLRKFIKNDDGSTRVEELRLPIIVNGKLWLKKIKDFLSKTELDYQLNQVNNKLLIINDKDKDKDNETVTTHKYRFLIKVTSPAAIKIHLDIAKYQISQKIGVDISDVIVDIYSWDHEHSDLQLIVMIEGHVKTEPSIIEGILRSVYGDIKLSLVNYDESVNNSTSGSKDDELESTLLREHHHILQSLNKVVYGLISDINKVLSSDEHDKVLDNAYYNENINEIHINALLDIYLTIIRGKQDRNIPYSEKDLKIIKTFFKNLPRELTFTKNTIVGTLANFKGQLGIIVNSDATNFTIKMEGDSVTVPKKSVQLVTGTQNLIYKLLSSKKNNYIDIKDLTIRNLPQLPNEIYRELKILGSKVTSDYINDIFSIGLDNGYYLQDNDTLPAPKTTTTIPVNIQNAGMSKKIIQKYLSASEQSIFSLNLSKSSLRKKIGRPFSIQDEKLLIGGKLYNNKWIIIPSDGNNWRANLLSSDISINLASQFDLVKDYIGTVDRDDVVKSPSKSTLPKLSKETISTPRSPSHLESPADEPIKSPADEPTKSPADEPTKSPADEPIGSLTSQPVKSLCLAISYKIGNSKLTLRYGSYSEVDIKSRPYLLKYNINNNKILKTNIMGCEQSRGLKSEVPPSMRPSRSFTHHTLKGQIVNPLQTKSKIFMDLKDSDTKMGSSKLVISENYYDTLANIGNIIVNTDIIILTNSNQPLGFLPYESVSGQGNYVLLNKTPGWRNILLPSDNNYPFSLNGESWSSINQFIHFNSINPLFINEFHDISEGALLEYRELFREGLGLKGVSLLSNLRTKYNFSEPSFWTLTLDRLHENNTIWLENVFDKLGLETSSIIERYGSITFKNFMLKRAYYSRISNNSLLKSLLVATGEANLLNKQGYQSIYEPNNSLLETRFYLNNRDEVTLYNSEIEDSLKHNIAFRNKIRDGVVKYIKSRRDIPTLQVLQSEPVSIIGVGNPDIQEAYRLIISQIMDENRLYFYKVLEETRQPLSSQLKAKNEYLSDQYQSKLLSLFTKTISPVDVKGEVTPSSKYLSDEVGDSFETSDIPWDLIYADQKIFKTFTAIQIDLLNSYLSESHLVGYDVPPDGDCLFHSLVDQLYYNGFTPLNRTKEPRYDMSTIKKDLSFTINGNLVPELTHVQAGLQARLEIAEKIRDNKLEIYLNSDGHATTVKHAVDIELSDSDPEHYRPELEEGDDTNFNRYIDILKESAVADNLLDGNKTGIWGGQIEIWAAAALYNVNIRVFTLDAYGKIDNINGILYSADSAHEKFPQGNIYNPSSLQGEIKIAWLSLQGTSAHYITLRNDECCLKYLINKSGDVKRYISDSVIIKVGENFNSNFGTFSTLMEPEVSGDSISEDLALCYFTLPSDTSEPKNVYYFGNRIGLQTGDEVGVRFT